MWIGKSWNELDNKKRKHLDKDFVSCDENYEKVYLKSKYTWCSNFDNCWEKCCSEVKGPRPRDKFEACLKNCCNSKL